MKKKKEFFAKVHEIFTENSLSEYLTDEILEKFYQLCAIMLETNEKMNITAITDEESVIARHFADSLLLLRIGIESGAKVCDIGCGGGFPSFPIAITRSDITVMGVDSTAKKIAYVNDTAAKLDLKNLTAISARAEDISGTDGEYREKFDLVCARAVASLPILAELCMPFVAVGGRFVALKSKTADEELAHAKKGIITLGGKIEKVEKLLLIDRTLEEGSDAERTLITIRKTSETQPKYPRAYAQIKKKPL